MARADEALQVTIEGYDGAIFFGVNGPAAPKLLDVFLRFVDRQKGRILYHIVGRLKMHGIKLAQI